MSTSNQEVSNDNIKVVVTKAPGCRVTFDITVAPTGTQSAYTKAVRSVNKEVSLPGFRKGKAPEKLVIQHYGKHVDREWRNMVLNYAFEQAIELTKLSPLHQEAVQAPEVKKISLEGAEVTLKFESQPELPTIDIKLLSLAQPAKAEISQENIDHAIEDLRLFHANWKDITDRPVQEDDYIDVDIDALESPSYNICTNERFQVNADRMPHWMRKIVLGMNVDQSAEGTSEREDKFLSGTNAPDFKPTPVRVTIKSIKQADLPAVDDELAKKAGVDTVEELQKRIVSSLERTNVEKIEWSLRDELQNQLLEKFVFDVPDSFVEMERQIRVRNRIRGLRSRQVSEAEIQQQQQQIEEAALVDAEGFLRLYFLSQVLVKEKGLVITQADLFQEFTRQMQQLPPEEQAIEPQMEPSSLRGQLLAVLAIRKAEDWLMSQLLSQ